MDTRDKIIIGIVGGIFLVFVIILLFVKKQFVQFSLGYLLLSIGAVFILLVIVFVIYKVSSANTNAGVDNKNEKLPPAITRDEAYEIALIAVQKKPYLDYIDEFVKSDNVEELGEGKKNSIYTLHATRGTYVNLPYYVILNMHYPNKNITILKNPTKVEVVRAKMLSSIHPERPIDVKTTFNENPLLGTRQIVQEPIAKDNDKQKKEDPLDK